MKRITITIMIALLLITSVSAGVGLGVLFNINPVTDYEKTTPSVSDEKTLILTVDGKSVEVITNEKEFDDGNNQSNVDSVEGTETSIELIGVGVWKENEYGDKGFDEDKLKELKCDREGTVLDSKVGDCVDK